MYKFIDVHEVSDGVVHLPSEALMINGEYIENQISGYRTLSVSGREALSPDVVTYTTGVRDGSRVKSKRFPERIITVNYQLIAESNEAFREAYNKLAAILNVEDAELIFNDEQDKFFVGTPCTIDTVQPGRNAVTGSFEILCADPFKYSVVEYEATPDMDDGSILVDYGGTYKAFPTLRAEFYQESEASDDGETTKTLTGAGDCGFVAFFNESEKIVQIGDPDEVDGTNTNPKSQTLANGTFNKTTSWGTAAKSQWKVNNGIAISDAIVANGNVGMVTVSNAAAIAQVATNAALAAAGATIMNTNVSGTPVFNYKASAKATNRTADSVKITLSLTASLAKDSNYFGRGYGLTAVFKIGSKTVRKTLKNSTEFWRGKSGHTITYVFTVTNVPSESTSIPAGSIKIAVERSDSVSGGGNAGKLPETSCKAIPITEYIAPSVSYLAPTDFGTGDYFHGASITRVLPADAAGDVGATNFTLTYSQEMAIGRGSNATKQIGAFQVLLVSGSGTSRKVVASVQVHKSADGKKGTVSFSINGFSAVGKVDVDLSYNNKYFKSSKTSTITKSGDSVTFDICGIKKTYRDADIASAVVTEVTFAMYKYKNRNPLTYNGLYWAKFVKHNCDTWKDIPNKFSAGDVVEADCKNGEIYLNGNLMPSLGALGNDWEEFVLNPGLNQIGVAHSEWLTGEYVPNFKVLYREVFL